MVGKPRMRAIRYTWMGCLATMLFASSGSAQTTSPAEAKVTSFAMPVGVYEIREGVRSGEIAAYGVTWTSDTQVQLWIALYTARGALRSQVAVFRPLMPIGFGPLQQLVVRSDDRVGLWYDGAFVPWLQVHAPDYVAARDHSILLLEGDELSIHSHGRSVLSLDGASKYDLFTMRRDGQALVALQRKWAPDGNPYWVVRERRRAGRSTSKPPTVVTRAGVPVGFIPLACSLAYWHSDTLLAFAGDEEFEPAEREAATKVVCDFTDPKRVSPRPHLHDEFVLIAIDIRSGIAHPLARIDIVVDDYGGTGDSISPLYDQLVALPSVGCVAMLQGKRIYIVPVAKQLEEAKR